MVFKRFKGTLNFYAGKFMDNLAIFFIRSKILKIITEMFLGDIFKIGKSIAMAIFLFL